jgi:hypothetical protein
MLKTGKAKKWIVALALATAALTMLGCAAPLAQAAEANITDTTIETAEVTEPYSAYGAGGYGANGATGGYGAYGIEDDTTRGVGSRGGYGGYGDQSVYGDACLTETDPVTGEVSTYAVTEADQTATLEGFGSQGALDDNDLSLADMLTYALQDEYLAHAEYDLILSEYGSVRPFTNIIRAEETHIDTLLPLFETYGITAPADDAASRVASVASLTAAYQAGVNAEVNNIAMYETFLDQNLPDDVRIVFESLMHASENHLRAFQNRL